ncbi:MAG: DUF3737 family protein [Bacteroidales bacterium]|nr:DUF3737 family protein [Bacteroidales bacterium]
MDRISDLVLGGERPLYASHNLIIENVTIEDGESAIKECGNLEVTGCRFQGKYPLWCCSDTIVKDCHFTEGARAAIWYSRDMDMSGCKVIAPKMFREMDRLKLKGCYFTDAEETLWDCRGVDLEDCRFENATYIFMRCSDVTARRIYIEGRYAFQYARNVEIHDSVLDTKDSLWEAENVTIYDSTISGEYIGWYSRNLHLVRCRLAGTQPLCYATGLVLEDCTMDADADLAFEYSDVHATIRGNVTSIKNPRSGHIHADSCSQVILDSNIKAPGDCVIDLDRR